MAKTVNVSVIITRDGKTTAQNFERVGYASGVLSTLQSWGTTRVAAMVDGIKAPPSPGGSVDLRMELRADHGAGTSEVVVGYTGISQETADEIQGAMLGAVSGVLK